MPEFRRISLFDNSGQRKYLNKSERQKFYRSTMLLDLERRLFCRIIHFTGARIGEVITLRTPQIDFSDKTIILNTLKQRQKKVYRQVPLPDHMLDDLLAFLDTCRKIEGIYDLGDVPLWSFGIRTGSRIIKQVMQAAEITGERGSAKGLRHGFAVHAVTKAPLTLVSKWMGHASLKTTAIYLDVSGIEEREWAKKLWDEEE